MDDTPRVPTSRRELRKPAVLATTAMVIACLWLAPGIAFASDLSDQSDPSAWKARPYSPLPWSAIGAPGGSLSLSFAGESGGLADDAGVGTGFTVVQPAATGSLYFAPEALSVADGALTITSGAMGAASQQNVLGVGIAADNRVTRVSVHVSGRMGSGGRGGIWFGATEGDRIELALEAPADGAGRTVALIERQAGAVRQTATVAVPAGPVKLELVVDSLSATVTGRVTSASGDAEVGSFSNMPSSFVDGSLLDKSTRPADSAVTAMGGVLAANSTAADAAPSFLTFDNFEVADATPAPVPAPAASAPPPEPGAPPPAPSAPPPPASAENPVGTPGACPNPPPSPSPSPAPAMEHPQPPSELRVYATDSANDLIWSASRSERIVGYTIEAAPSASGPWQPLTTKASPSLAFRDVSPAVPGTTFYRVTATDAHGLVSEPTIPVSFTRSAPVPAAPPAVPAQRAPLLVAENVPNAVEPESVIFTGSLPAWGRDGTGLVFGAAGPTTAVPSIAGEAAITGMDGVSVVTGSAGTPFTPEQRKVGGSPYFAEGQLIPGADGTLVLPLAAPVAVVEQSKVAERQRNDEVAFDPFTFGVLAALSAFAIGRRIRRSTRVS